MNKQSQNDVFGVVAIAILLILTAWGNAIAMLVVAVLGLVIGLLFFRERITQGGILAAIVGFVVSIIIAVVML